MVFLVSNSVIIIITLFQPLLGGLSDFFQGEANFLGGGWKLEDIIPMKMQLGNPIVLLTTDRGQIKLPANCPKPFVI